MPRQRMAIRLIGVGVGVIVALSAGGCSATKAPPHKAVSAISIAAGTASTSPKSLTLTADAIRRLELTTEVSTSATAIPWSAVIYDKKGAPWVYTSPRDSVFVRVPITIDRIEGEVATLSSGPPAGTKIVTRSAIKLYGAETGVGGGH